MYSERVGSLVMTVMTVVETVLVFPSEGGVAWVFQGISRGKTQATPTSDGKTSSLY